MSSGYKELKSLILNHVIQKYEISEDGVVRNRDKGNILKGWVEKRGYRAVSLMIQDRPIRFGIHRLVAGLYVFNPRPKEYNVINHLDGNKLNNRASNLEWGTLANNKHAKETGLLESISGENSTTAKISNETAHMICKLLCDGYSNKKIIEELGLPYDDSYQSIVTSIRTGRNWKDISSQYDFEKVGSHRKTPAEDVHAICLMITRGIKIRHMMTALGYDQSKYPRFKGLVYDIRTGRCYKDISSNYFEKDPSTTIENTTSMEKDLVGGK